MSIGRTTENLDKGQNFLQYTDFFLVITTQNTNQFA
jgi:hypothetical protein